MGSFACVADKEIWFIFGDWLEVARDEVETIGGWRENPTGWNFPTVPFGNGEPLGTLHLHTAAVVGWFMRESPGTSPTPFQDIYAAVGAWYTDHNANRIPPQNELQTMLDRAEILLMAAWDKIRRRSVGAKSNNGTADHTPDGPDADRPGRFSWENHEFFLTKRNWELARALWNQEGLTFSDAGEIVWGEELTPSSTIKTQLSRLNAELTRHNVPLAWRTAGEKIYRQ